MPAAIVFPIAAAMPNHIPSTCSNRPRLCTAMLGSLEDASAVVDNRILNQVLRAVIILAAPEIASRKKALKEQVWRASSPQSKFRS